MAQSFRSDSLDLNPRVPFNRLKWRTNHTNDYEDYSEYTDRVKTDAMAHKIVYKPAEDALRNNFRLVIPKNEDLQAQYQQALDNLQLQKVLTQQEAFKFAHGDAYIAINVVEDGKVDPFEPINTDKLVKIQSIHAFGNTHVKGYHTNDDPTSEDYMKEDKLILRSKSAGATVNKDGDVENKPAPYKLITLDRSRYCHITQDKFEDDIMGTSIIKRCEPQLNTMAIATESVGKILREFVFKIVKSDAIMGKTDAEFDAAVDQIGHSLNTEDTAFIGNEDEIVKLSTQTSGINVLLDYAWQSLAAASGIPKSVLIGEQAGTLAGASQDVLNYYDSIKAIQEQELKPELVKIVRLLMWSSDVAGGRLDPDSLDWHIEFNPLWTPDGKTQAETEYTKAQTAVMWSDHGIYGTDEVRHMLEGQANGELQGLQKVTGDSADDIEPTADEIKQYKQDEKKAKHGKAYKWLSSKFGA